MRAQRLILAAMAITAAFMTSAQEEINIYVAEPTTPEQEIIDRVIENTQFMYFGEKEDSDSINYRSLLNQFYEDQFRHIQDPHAPYFMLMSRNGNVAMGIGGELKMIGGYDWNGSIEGTAFIPAQIPIPADPTNNQYMQLAPMRTALFVSVFGNSERFGQFQIYIHGKFNGADRTFRMDRAYATVGDLTFGYAKSTFDDPAAQPPTIDTEGPNSEIDDTRVLVRYMHKLSSKFTIAASVEGPDANIPTTDQYQPIAHRVPDVGAFIQYANAQQHVRLSGIIKNMGYRDMVSASNHNVTGWGLNLSTKLHPVPTLAVYAAANGGYGIGNFANDLSYTKTDLLGLTSTPGKMYAPLSYGWYVGLQYFYSSKVYSTLVASQERLVTKSDATYSGDNYKYGLYGTANLFWEVTPRIQVGAEFNIGKRVNIDGSNRTSYRAALMGQFSF